MRPWSRRTKDLGRSCGIWPIQVLAPIIYRGDAEVCDDMQRRRNPYRRRACCRRFSPQPAIRPPQFGGRAASWKKEAAASATCASGYWRQYATRSRTMPSGPPNGRCRSDEGAWTRPVRKPSDHCTAALPTGVRLAAIVASTRHDRAPAPLSRGSPQDGPAQIAASAITATRDLIR